MTPDETRKVYTCRNCGPATELYTVNSEGKIRNRCKKCTKISAKRYRSRHREEIAKKTKKWIEKNKNRVIQNRIKYCKENKEKIQKQQKKYREEHREELRKKNSIQSKKYYQENKKECKIRHKKWREKNKEHERIQKLEYRYGISAKEYGILLEKQKECPLCFFVFDLNSTDKNKRPVIDHTEINGIKNVRGLLDDNCNKALGLFKENTEIMRRAAKYLDNNLNIQKQHLCNKKNHHIGIGHCKYPYGFSETELVIFRENNPICFICCKYLSGKTKMEKSHIDHIEKNNTIIVRGVLCGHCNLALGLFKNNPERIRRAITYIEENSLITA